MDFWLQNMAAPDKDILLALKVVSKSDVKGFQQPKIDGCRSQYYMGCKVFKNKLKKMRN